MIGFLVLIQLLLPLALIGWLAIAPPRNLLGICIQALATAIALFAIAQTGLWVFPPWWTPYLYGFLLVLAFLFGLQWHKPRRLMPSSWLSWSVIIGFVAFGIFAANEAAHSVMGQMPPSVPVVNLTFPLRGGNYLILNGGSDIRINAHLKTMDTSIPRFRAYRGNGYGVDIIKIGLFGLRAKGIIPRDPAVYYIYGEPVLAPCTGQVITAIDGLPDMRIPKVDRANLAGNHLILRCDEVDVVLAHFRPNSLAVKSGMQVKVGDPIAEVGNSGVSDEPHLHIHAQRPGTSTAPMSGEPVPMRFDGRFLTRNDQVTVL